MRSKREEKESERGRKETSTGTRATSAMRQKKPSLNLWLTFFPPVPSFPRSLDLFQKRKKRTHPWLPVEERADEAPASGAGYFIALCR